MPMGSLTIIQIAEHAAQLTSMAMLRHVVHREQTYRECVTATLSKCSRAKGANPKAIIKQRHHGSDGEGYPRISKNGRVT